MLAARQSPPDFVADMITSAPIPTPKVDEETSSQTSSTGSTKKPKRRVSMVHPGDFEAERHFYPRVLNANIHPLVGSFFELGNERILARFAHLNPQIKEAALREILAYKPKYFRWAGKSSIYLNCFLYIYRFRLV